MPECFLKLRVIRGFTGVRKEMMRKWMSRGRQSGGIFAVGERGEVERRLSFGAIFKDPCRIQLLTLLST